jgi:hypothetical protein
MLTKIHSEIGVIFVPRGENEAQPCQVISPKSHSQYMAKLELRPTQSVSVGLMPDPKGSRTHKSPRVGICAFTVFISLNSIDSCNKSIVSLFIENQGLGK